VRPRPARRTRHTERLQNRHIVMSGVASSPTDRPVFVLRRRVCLAPPPGLLHGPARSGDAIGGLQPLRCPLPYGTPASRAGGSGGRTGGHRDPSAGRAFSPGVCRSGERSVPAEAAPPPVARLFFGAPGLIQGQSRTQSGPRLSRQLDSHGAAFPWGTHRADAGDRSSCQSFPQRKPRASPLVARLARVSLHLISGRPGPIPQTYQAAPSRAPYP